MNDVRLALEACGLLAAMFIAFGIGLRRRIGAVLLAILSLSWLGADKQFEGDVLIRINNAHGFVSADLVAVLGLVVAGWLWRINRPTGRRPRRPRPGRNRRTPR